MSKTYTRSLFIFRRDLRSVDNTALQAAMTSSNEVMAVFILDPRQLNPHPYQSQYALHFMSESLRELSDAIQKQGGRLYFFHGVCEDIVPVLFKQLGIKALYINRDYTPFARQRDHALAALCKTHQVDFHACADALLNEPDAVAKSDGQPYTVFTPFYRRASQNPIARPSVVKHSAFYVRPVAGEYTKPWDLLSRAGGFSSTIKGGRTAGLSLLKSLSDCKAYADQRDILALDATTHLSAHAKFGTVSVREIAAAIEQQLSFAHPLIRQLYWRDFFTHIAVHFPHVFGHCFHRKYDQLKWSNHQEHFQRWCEGTTGFPIVDAGMRELNATGYMHNRARMITASFLVKDLHIDWRKGERYFASRLVDYDPCVNNGNWQWAASTGCDAQPYFRIFNPWLQAKRFDPEAVYIKKWIPELKALNAKSILNFDKDQSQRPRQYPAPLIDHAQASAKAKAMFHSIGQTVER